MKLVRIACLGAIVTMVAPMTSCVSPGSILGLPQAAYTTAQRAPSSLSATANRTMQTVGRTQQSVNRTSSRIDYGAAASAAAQYYTGF